MKAVILSIGTELATGQAVDTNSAWIARQLTPYGVRVIYHLTVDDDTADLAGAFARAAIEADLVIATGGLGPTPDDLTREALAVAMHVPLEECESARKALETLFAGWKRPMPERNLVQAMLPKGAEVVPNDWGTAPGIRAELSGAIIFALPGVPREMKNMFAAHVRPVVEARMGAPSVAERTLRCFGIAEAVLADKLGDLLDREKNPLVGTTASGAILSVRIVAQGKDAADAARLADRASAEARRRVGDPVFGEDDDTLQSVVSNILMDRGETISAAESCTGGLIAKRLTDIPGSSAFLLEGLVTYSNESKTRLVGVPAELIAQHGAVSEPVARAMAEGARERARSTYALASTGIAGPGGGSADKPVGLVFVALADDAGTEVKRLLLGEHLSRAEIRDRATKASLNMLRLRLMRNRRD